MRTKKAEEAHEALWADICDVADKYEQAGIPVEDVLAILARLVGKYIACMDPLKYDKQLVLNLVATNIKGGNEDMCDYILSRRRLS
jgi:hypothetical protein